jgi:acetyl-CoA carboxylase biotin carboxyl carrier protein
VLPFHSHSFRFNHQENVLDVKQISELIDILSNSDVATLKYEEEAFKLTLQKARKPESNAATAVIPAMTTMVVPSASPAPEEVAAEGQKNDAPPSAPEEDLLEMTTPFVGTFYAAPTPDAPDFVKVGSKVSKGQVMCIVEAMKLMNEIEAEWDGEIVEILARNAQPVEFGETLFRIRPA